MKTKPKTPRILDHFPRRQIGRLPLTNSAAALADQKMKLSFPLRRALLRSRQHVVEFPRTTAKPELGKLAAKLATLSLVQLGRRLAQSARRAATAKHLLVKMSPGSKFRRAMQNEQDRQIEIFQQAHKEVEFRTVPTQL